MTRAEAVWLFLVFAFAYFFSALVRAVTATLAPVFSAELGLGASDLGLLAGAYYLGFALLQLPLGSALDRHGPKRVMVVLLSLAVLGCAAFAMAGSLAQLIAARALVGVGVSACLMAPLTAYRHRFAPAAQMRANSWMLMTGSLGMVASTLPVQWLLPHLGWRGLFWGVTAGMLLAWALIAWLAPRDHPAAPAAAHAGYRQVWAHPMFQRMLPMGFFSYGGLLAVQTLWAGPWMTQVGSLPADAAAGGLLGINLTMLLTFLAWGFWMPRLQRHGFTAERLIGWGWPLHVLVLAAILWLGPRAGAAWWAAWCASVSVVSLSQPAIGQAFAKELAGRALSAYNLVIFAGVFAIQWAMGLVIDGLRAHGADTLAAFRGAFGLLLACCLASGLWYRRGARA